MIKSKSLIYTKIIVILLIVITVLILIQKLFSSNKNQQQKLVAPPSPTPQSFNFPKDNNKPHAVSEVQSTSNQEYIFYDKAKSELIIFNEKSNQVIYSGIVNSYAYLSPYVYVFDKSNPNQIIQINVANQTVNKTRPSTLSPIDFITQCSEQNNLLVIGNYSAANRSSSLILYNPSNQTSKVILPQITATEAVCVNNNLAVLFSKADFAGASRIQVVNLVSKEILLDTNGNNYQISQDGSLIAIENNGITITNLTTQKNYPIPESARSHFGWFNNDLLLIENLRPGISIKKIDQQGNVILLNSENEKSITIRKLLQVFDLGFIYQSSDGLINQEVYIQKSP